MEQNINRFSGYDAFIAISVIACLFSYWFAYNQLSFITPNTLISTYPFKYLTITLARCYCTVAIFYLIVHGILAWLSNHKVNPLYSALTFAPLLLVYIKFSIVFIVFLLVLLQLSVLFSVLNRDDYKELTSRYVGDATALLVLFILHLLLTTAYSPLSWNEAWHFSAGPEEILVVAPIYKGYVLAKQFVFSTMDYSEWAGILNPPITLNSIFMELLTFIFDLPSVSVEAFHKVLSATYFILIVAGSFGFYLFLKYAANVQAIFALFGGCLFYLSGVPHLNYMTHFDAGIFIAPYVVYSYGLLLISRAFATNNLLLSAWAGAAIAAQFFLLTPHPEGVIYSFVFFAVFVAGLFIFSVGITLKRKIQLAVIAMMTLLLLSTFILLPIIIDELKQNMHTLAHHNDIRNLPFESLARYVWILMIFTPISLLLLFMQKRLSAFYFSLLFLVAFLQLLVFDTKQINMILISTLHIGLHISFSWRIGIFYCLTVYSIVIISLDAIAKQAVLIIGKRFPTMVNLVN